MEFGTDFALMNGDFQTNAQGDLGHMEGIENLKQALQRRFDTPLGALFYDTNYGNSLLLKLSSPMGLTFEQDAAADVSAAMLADPLVASVDVMVICNREKRTATINVDFVAQDGSSDSFSKVVSVLV